MKKVSDIARELQTPALKRTVFLMIRDFVYKYANKFNLNYSGTKDDLAHDLYDSFVDSNKLHRSGERFSELDRFEYEKLGGDEWTGTDQKKLAAFIQRYVNHRLIDLARTSKSRPTNVSLSESSDYQLGSVSINKLFHLASTEDSDTLEDFLTPSTAKKGKILFARLPREKRSAFKQALEEAKSSEDGLSKKFQLFFDIIASADWYESILNLSVEGDDGVLRVSDYSPEISEYKLHGSPAVRIKFSEELPVDLYEEIVDIFEDVDFIPYVQKGNVYYFVSK